MRYWKLWKFHGKTKLRIRVSIQISNLIVLIFILKWMQIGLVYEENVLRPKSNTTATKPTDTTTSTNDNDETMDDFNCTEPM